MRIYWIKEMLADIFHYRFIINCTKYKTFNPISRQALLSYSVGT